MNADGGEGEAILEAVRRLRSARLAAEAASAAAREARSTAAEKSGDEGRAWEAFHAAKDELERLTGASLPAEDWDRSGEG